MDFCRVGNTHHHQDPSSTVTLKKLLQDFGCLGKIYGYYVQVRHNNAQSLLILYSLIWAEARLCSAWWCSKWVVVLNCLKAASFPTMKLKTIVKDVWFSMYEKAVAQRESMDYGWHTAHQLHITRLTEGSLSDWWTLRNIPLMISRRWISTEVLEKENTQK